MHATIAPALTPTRRVAAWSKHEKCKWKAGVASLPGGCVVRCATAYRPAGWSRSRSGVAAYTPNLPAANRPYGAERQRSATRTQPAARTAQHSTARLHSPHARAALAPQLHRSAGTNTHSRGHSSHCTALHCTALHSPLATRSTAHATLLSCHTRISTLVEQSRGRQLQTSSSNLPASSSTHACVRRDVPCTAPTLLVALPSAQSTCLRLCHRPRVMLCRACRARSCTARRLRSVALLSRAAASAARQRWTVHRSPRLR